MYARIEKSPAREQDMAALMREYNSTRQNYETLLKKTESHTGREIWKDARRANNSRSDRSGPCAGKAILTGHSQNHAHQSAWAGRRSGGSVSAGTDGPFIL